MSTRPEVNVSDGTKRAPISVVSRALLSGRAPAQSKSPKSPLTNKALEFMAPASEYRAAFTATAASEAEAPTRSTRRGNAHTADLWLPVGKDEYATETAMAYPGHHPPPAAPRPVPKYEPSTLHLHAETVHRTSFTDPAAAVGAGALGRQAAHKPKERTAKIPLAFASATEYRDRFRAAAAADALLAAPAVTSAAAHRSPAGPQAGGAAAAVGGAHKPHVHAMGSPGKPLLGVSQYAEAFGSGGGGGGTTSRGSYVAPGAAAGIGTGEASSPGVPPALARMVASGTATFGRPELAAPASPAEGRAHGGKAGGRAFAPAVSPIKVGGGTGGMPAPAPSPGGRAPAHVPTGSFTRLGGGPAKMQSLTTNKDIDAPLADPWALMTMLYPPE